MTSDVHPSVTPEKGGAALKISNPRDGTEALLMRPASASSASLSPALLTALSGDRDPGHGPWASQG